MDRSQAGPLLFRVLEGSVDLVVEGCSHDRVRRSPKNDNRHRLEVAGRADDLLQDGVQAGIARERERFEGAQQLLDDDRPGSGSPGHQGVTVGRQNGIKGPEREGISRPHLTLEAALDLSRNRLGQLGFVSCQRQGCLNQEHKARLCVSRCRRGRRERKHAGSERYTH